MQQGKADFQTQLLFMLTSEHMGASAIGKSLSLRTRNSQGATPCRGAYTGLIHWKNASLIKKMHMVRFHDPVPSLLGVMVALAAYIRAVADPPWQM